MGLIVLIGCQSTPQPNIEATVQAAIAAALPRETALPEIDAEATVAVRVRRTVEAISAQKLANTPTVTVTATPVPTTTSLPTPTLTPVPTPTSSPLPKATLTPTPTSTPRPTATPTLSKVIAEIKPAVVQIISDAGTGSGFVFSEDGWVVTNAHVVGNSMDVAVMIDGRTPIEGRVVGLDEEVDLAVIRLEGFEGLKILTFGDSDAVSEGEDVVAIGFPLGDILGSTATVTKGVVSSRRYTGSVEYLQTDAAINPGNSGGPLINTSGEVVGINTSRIDVALGRQVLGIGLAISSNTVQKLLPDLMNGRFVRVSGEAAPEKSFATGPDQESDFRYVSDRHWYSVDVAEGWRISSSNPDRVLIWEPVTESVILIAADIIDPEKFSSIKSYVARWEPGPAPSWTDFRVLNDGPIRSRLPVPAHEYLTRHRNDGERWQGRVHWFVLGNYLISLEAIAEKRLWDEEADQWSQMHQIQDSFDPSVFTDDDSLFSISHPPEWKKGPGESTEYVATQSSGTGILWVEVRSGSTKANVEEYGDSVELTDPKLRVLSRGKVFERRPNPGYRIDYEGSVEDGGAVRGALLLTLSGDAAIWLTVQSELSDWADLEPTVERILSRFAVAP
ncbi:MAG: trypsin-like peptidase domain-containing protein [Chloroflexi bacterium]|nr:trypsin-like peptidase domain-containing protein [Chloroflexota bacterium]